MRWLPGAGANFLEVRADPYISGVMALQEVKGPETDPKLGSFCYVVEPRIFVGSDGSILNLGYFGDTLVVLVQRNSDDPVFQIFLQSSFKMFPSGLSESQLWQGTTSPPLPTGRSVWKIRERLISVSAYSGPTGMLGPTPPRHTATISLSEHPCPGAESGARLQRPNWMTSQINVHGN